MRVTSCHAQQANRILPVVLPERAAAGGPFPLLDNSNTIRVVL